MRETLRKFESRFGSANVALLTANEIKTWLSEMDLAVKTRNRHLGYVQNIFNIAKSWGLLSTNPLDEVTPFNDATRRGRQVSVFTPEQLKSFLRALRPNFVPFFAISAFKRRYLAPNAPGAYEIVELPLAGLVLRVAIPLGS